jgi:hypothetical protein
MGPPITIPRHRHRLGLSLFVIVCCLLLLPDGYYGFATHLTREYCDREMAEGVLMMQKPVVRDSSTYRLVVTREVAGEGEPKQEVVANNSATILPTDILTVKFEPKIFQSVFEVQNGAGLFEDGHCEGKARSYNNKGARIHLSGRSPIVIQGVWAKGFNGGVKIADPVVLHISDSSSGAVAVAAQDDL